MKTAGFSKIAWSYFTEAYNMHFTIADSHILQGGPKK